MFEAYQSKPITRMAFQIMLGDEISRNKGESFYRLYRPEEDYVIDFKSHELPIVGGWIVQLTEEDTYYVSDTIFRDRNIVSDNLN